jgi:hypothetical protein
MRESFGCEGRCPGSKEDWCCFGHPKITCIEKIEFLPEREVNNEFFQALLKKIEERDKE